ncbi:MAG: DUF494 family protein [Halanaerobiaceae bacterium]|nr:DUF494 family protein [Halanaerobiaceae bacterium]
MKNNIIEIVSLLIQRLLVDGEVVMEEEIVMELLELGYEIKDIDEAFELIYNGTEIIEAENVRTDSSRAFEIYNRVFSEAEKLYLPLNIQGLLIKVIFSGVLSIEESEEIIKRLIQASYHEHISRLSLWDVIEEVVEDHSKLYLLLNEISEFKDIVPDAYRYLN